MDLCHSDGQRGHWWIWQTAGVAECSLHNPGMASHDHKCLFFFLLDPVLSLHSLTKLLVGLRSFVISLNSHKNSVLSSTSALNSTLSLNVWPKWSDLNNWKSSGIGGSSRIRWNKQKRLAVCHWWTFLSSTRAVLTSSDNHCLLVRNWRILITGVE